MRDEASIEIYDFNYDTLTISYGCPAGTHGKCKMKILDNRTHFGSSAANRGLRTSA